MRQLLLVAVALIAAGCTAPEDASPLPASPVVGTTPPHADECAALAARQPSGNAPRLPLFAGDATDVAAALAAALGDPLVSREPRAPTGGFLGQPFPEVKQEWETGRGWIELHVNDTGAPWAWRYWGEGFWAPLDERAAREAFFQVLTRLGMPVDTLADPGVLHRIDEHQERVDGAAQQQRTGRDVTLSGHNYGSPGADFWIVRDREMGDRSQFTLRVMHDLSAASVALPTQEVARIANLAARCHLADHALALETFQPALTPADDPFIHGESIAYAAAVVYQDTPEPCHGSTLLRVVVDAITGAVLAVGPPSVGCVT